MAREDEGGSGSANGSVRDPREGTARRTSRLAPGADPADLADKAAGFVRPAGVDQVHLQHAGPVPASAVGRPLGEALRKL